MTNEQNTGYSSMDNCGDVDSIFKRRTIPAGTLVTLALLPAALDLTPGKERINVRAEVVDPDEFDGIKIDQAQFLGNDAKDPDAPFNTSYHVARANLTRIVAAVLNKPVTDPEVGTYWSSIPRPDDSLESCARAYVEGLNRLVGKTFQTRTALKVSLNKDGSPKINPNTGDPYEPQVTIGRPMYPRPEGEESRAA